jgi:tyrosine-protein phosphatase SIW14
MEQVATGVFRGPRPTDLKGFAELGIKRIVDLESGVHDFFYDDAYELEDPKNYGLLKVDIPVFALQPPSPHDVNRIMRVLEPESIEKYGSVYVHCEQGVDRTGFVIAVYRMRIEGWSFDRARDEMYAHGFHRYRFFWWSRQLKRYEGTR